MKEHNWVGWGRTVVWMAPLVALAGCQVLFGVELPAEDAAGAGGGGQAGAARCNLCGAFFDGAPTSAACIDNGPPSSFALATALNNCLCRPDTCGSTDCKAVCETNAAPSKACKACSVDACEAEANACLLDDGKGGAGGGLGTSGQGGSAGGGSCADDAACGAARGEGSLCVGSACTKAADMCDATLLVVVVPGRAVDDASLAEGCHFRDFDGARTAIGATTTRLAVYADEAVSTKALDFATAATLEGHHSDPSKAVAVTVPQAAGTPLVRFGQGGALKGVKINGGGVTTAVRHEAGTLAVSGPTVLTNASPALELVGSANATVTGTEAAPVRLSGNRRGVFVPAEATLTMQGDAKAESLVVEGTNGGAAVLFEAAGTSPCSTLSKVTLRGNTGSSGDGTGAIEVRRGRQVVVDGCTFVHNRQSITLSGAGGGSGSSVDAFLGVQLQNNVFTDALPLEPANTGSVLCGDNLGSSGTTLIVRDGNVFPGAPGTCASLPDPSQFGCDGGQVLGHNSPGMTVNPECIGGAFQCGGGT